MTHQLRRREFMKGLAVAAVASRIPGSPEATRLKATSFNHISYQSMDYLKTRDFYVDLLGFQVSDQDENQLYVWAGDQLISCKHTTRPTPPTMDHFGLTVQPWDVDVVQAALKERGLSASISKNDPHDPYGSSVFTRDPNMYTVQLGKPDLETKPAPVPSNAPLKAVGLHHISYLCLDYKKTRDWFVDLLQARVTNDDGKQARLWFG